MTFSTTYDFMPVQPQKKPSWLFRFSSQPHQLFFTSAIFFAITVMLGTFISFIREIPIDFYTLHSFGLIFGVFTNAFLGFLITVIPKYTNSILIDKKKYFIPWIVLQLSLLATLCGLENIGKIAVVGVFFYFNYIFYITIKKGRAIDKKESIFLNLIFFFGGVFLLSEVIFQTHLSLLIFFGYLLSLVFIVAQRMIPAFYSVNLQIIPWEKPKYLAEIATMLFLSLGVTIQFELILLMKLVSLSSMLFFGYIVFNLNIYKKAPAILTILMVGFIWLEIAFCVLFVESIFEIPTLKMALHIFAIGFVGNLLIGFGSRVIMGHAVPAQKIEADRLTFSLFILVQVIVITRVVASLLFLNNSLVFMGILHLSSWLWIGLFSVWTFRYGKTLLRINN